MSILAAEPAAFPSGLFQTPSFDTHTRRWLALHTKPRQEKSLARQLHEREIPFYLPLLANRVRVRKEIVHSYTPLFPSYLFLLASQEERLLALRTRRVVHALEVGDQQLLWRDLRQIHRLIDSGLPISAEGRLVPGTPVRIREGPLMGLDGVVVKSISGNRFVVTVDFIQRGASVIVDMHMLAACGPEHSIPA